jgi:hypothetical protein
MFICTWWSYSHSEHSVFVLPLMCVVAFILIYNRQNYSLAVLIFMLPDGEREDRTLDRFVAGIPRI